MNGTNGYIDDPFAAAAPAQPKRPISKRSMTECGAECDYYGDEEEARDQEDAILDVLKWAHGVSFPWHESTCYRACLDARSGARSRPAHRACVASCRQCSCTATS